VRSESACNGAAAKAPLQHDFNARAVYRMPSGRMARWKTAAPAAQGPDEAVFIYDAPYGGPPPSGLAEALVLGRGNWHLPVRVS
jgi:hypothetical protein